MNRALLARCVTDEGRQNINLRACGSDDDARPPASRRQSSLSPPQRSLRAQCPPARPSGDDRDTQWSFRCDRKWHELAHVAVCERCRTAEPIEMPFEGRLVMNHILDGGPDIPRNWALLRAEVTSRFSRVSEVVGRHTLSLNV